VPRSRAAILVLTFALAAGASAQPRVGPAPRGGCARPSPCVSPIRDALARLRTDGRISAADDLEVHGLADLDGDGRREVLIEIVPERGVTGNTTYLLYLGREPCRRYAGEIFAMSIRAAGGSHCGALDLVAYSGGGCAGLAGAGDVLIFDGETYRPDPAGRFECECPLDGDDARRDPRCPRVD
jgi:hypothetical protein